MIDSDSLLVMQYMLNSSLPKEGTDILHLCGNDGYKALCHIHSRLHPKLIYYPIDMCHATPQQGINDSVPLYFHNVQWHTRMLVYILDYVMDPDNQYVQDILIANMYYASKIRQHVASKQYC